MKFANLENQKAIEENKQCEIIVENVNEIAMKVKEESKKGITETERVNLKKNIKFITNNLVEEGCDYIGRTEGL